MQKILLITGWAVGTQALQALQNALIQRAFEVELINIFNCYDAEVLKAHTQLAEQCDVIIGWSLGGQLATKLVQQLYEQTGELKVLITLASNPCFIANKNWPFAMQSSVFFSFKQSFEKDPMTTLKRFCYLVTQGAVNAKQDWHKLQNYLSADDLKLKSAGLDMLEQLNNVEIVQQYQGNQLHIFAEDDGLVSHKISQDMHKLAAKFLTIESIKGSHGFAVFQSEALSDKITGYLNRLKES